MPANYVYVASSWRCSRQPAMIEAIRRAGIACYDFRNPEAGTGFSWRETGGSTLGPKGSDLEPVDRYLEMIRHPRAVEGFRSDFDAMKRADAFVLVLPCGRSAHLELGWAVGAGRRTCVLLEDPVEPELMYRMVSKLARTELEVVEWLEHLPTTVHGLEIHVSEAVSPGEVRFIPPAGPVGRMPR